MMHMSNLIFLLHLVPLNSASSRGITPVNERGEIHRAIHFVFLNGGAVQLSTGTEVDAPRSGLVQRDMIEMLAVPGKFRLIASPFKALGERSTMREWWEPSETGFRGNEKFGEDEIDSRKLCADVRWADELFAEFFEHQGISKKILDSTLSVWTPKP